MRVGPIVSLLVFGVFFTIASVSAQPIGTFRWQIQPYCNLITVQVVQTPSGYTLDGSDNRCGAAQSASVVGLAFLNPNGTVGFGLTSVLPGGTPIHTEATIVLSTLSGTWRDSAGNSGNFVFTPGSGAAGAPRPVPSGGIAPASITAIQMANNAVSSTNIVDASITTADLAAPPQAILIGGELTVTLTPDPQVVRTIVLNAPSAGLVLVNASGFFEFDSTTIDRVGCSISTTTTVEHTFATYVYEAAANSLAVAPLATTRGFAVSAGSHTYNLVCYKEAGNATVRRASVTGIFIPL
jgi:hypothetical protein